MHYFHLKRMVLRFWKFDLTQMCFPSIEFVWLFGQEYPLLELLHKTVFGLLQMALGIGGIHGSFYSACVDIMHVLRENKEGLSMLLKAILNDPSVDWAADRHERAARKVL